MTVVGRLHPLLIHFPISLLLLAAAAEAVALTTKAARWRFVAVVMVRGAALFAVVAVFAGWQLAATIGLGGSSVLEWHRWFGTVAAALAAVAALATSTRENAFGSPALIYRITLFAAAVLMSAAGHLGGVLVWGADFLHL